MSGGGIACTEDERACLPKAERIAVTSPLIRHSVLRRARVASYFITSKLSVSVGVGDLTKSIDLSRSLTATAHTNLSSGFRRNGNTASAPNMLIRT
jgi:hypothetical protein